LSEEGTTIGGDPEQKNGKAVAIPILAGGEKAKQFGGPANVIIFFFPHRLAFFNTSVRVDVLLDGTFSL
jgi:hypothetical protein